jgi:hypothetical protein
MNRFAAALRRPMYLVVADYSDLRGIKYVVGSGDPVDSADDAADRLGNHHDHGREARVICIDMLTGTASDATAQCEAIIRQRCRERGIAAE